jgi:hypothetical protein
MSDKSQNKSDDQSQENEFEELDALLAEPAEEVTREAKITEPSPEDEFGDLGVLIERSGYQGLPGEPTTAVAGKKYICPVPECTTEPWFRMGLRTPPLCYEHGVVLVPAPDAG